VSLNSRLESNKEEEEEELQDQGLGKEFKTNGLRKN